MSKQVEVALRKVIIQTHHPHNCPPPPLSSLALTPTPREACAFSARALPNVLLSRAALHSLRLEYNIE